MDSDESPYLPAPTGPQSVGMSCLYLRDMSRPDPWAGGDVRELMVSLWYPALSSQRPRARYMTGTESALLLHGDQVTGVRADVLSTTLTNSVADATPTGERRTLPLVVLSPGFTKPRSTLTALAEDLASHGYVVAGIDHTYETVGTAFPDGRVTTCLSRTTPGRGPDFWRKVMTGRAADVSFVLDELTAPRSTWPHAGLIDPSRIAMVGHSAGGASVLPAMVADIRIRAGINIDGSTQDLIPDSGLARPVLFLGKQSNYTPGSSRSASTWERDWPLLTGWRRWLVVAGAVHASFTDLALLAEQFGLDIGATLPAARAVEITRTSVRAFADLHLRGAPQPFLDRPSAHHREVIACALCG